MGRSQRSGRNPGQFGEDRLGDQHYPGTGGAATGAISNPALQPGGQTGYVYDWPGSWPSGSNPGGGGGGGNPDPLQPGGVDGPTSSPHGVDFWISRSSGQGTLWYYWIDVDNNPGPDTKRNLVEFLDDDNISMDYRNDVRARAMMLGWAG